MELYFFTALLGGQTRRKVLGCYFSSVRKCFCFCFGKRNETNTTVAVNNYYYKLIKNEAGLVDRHLPRFDPVVSER